MLRAPQNVNGRPNSDVVRPVASAIDLVQRSKGKWTIDFALMPLDEATKYERPFEHVREVVLPARASRRDDYRGQWWQYARPRPEMRAVLKGNSRYIATPRISKYRIFVWLKSEVLANDGTIVFAREDDYFFGILHSKLHQVWALKKGTALEDRPRYTPTSSPTFQGANGSAAPTQTRPSLRSGDRIRRWLLTLLFCAASGDSRFSCASSSPAAPASSAAG